MSVDRRASLLALRTVPVVAVFALTLVAFEAGVGVSERSGVAEDGLATHVYYAIGLFVLGGMDLGTPEGGPVWARGMLWVAYFLGPVITTTAVVEGFLAAVHPRWLATFRLRRHVVVVGGRHLSQLYLDAILEADPDRQVVVIDLDPVQGPARLRQVEYVRGDILHPASRATLRLDRAHGLVLTTPSDLRNLEAC